jgi:hypothetical protein
VAANGLEPNEDPRRLLHAPGAARSDVVLQGRVWAVVCAGAVDDPRRALRDAVIEILPDIVAIEVMRFSEALPAEERVRRELIIDLLAEPSAPRASSSSEPHSRVSRLPARGGS